MMFAGKFLLMLCVFFLVAVQFASAQTEVPTEAPTAKPTKESWASKFSGSPNTITFTVTLTLDALQSTTLFGPSKLAVAAAVSNVLTGYTTTTKMKSQVAADPFGAVVDVRVIATPHSNFEFTSDEFYNTLTGLIDAAITSGDLSSNIQAESTDGDAVNTAQAVATSATYSSYTSTSAPKKEHFGDAKIAGTVIASTFGAFVLIALLYFLVTYCGNRHVQSHASPSSSRPVGNNADNVV